MVKQDEQNTKLKEIDMLKWNRTEKPRKGEQRVDVYYYPPDDATTRLRSMNDVKKYCKKEGLNFNPNYFCFKPRNTTIEEDDESVEVRSFEECQALPEKNEWYEAIHEKIKMMKTREVWTLVNLPPHCKVIRSEWE